MIRSSKGRRARKRLAGDASKVSEEDVARTSEPPEPTRAEIKKWLEELNRLRDEPGEANEVRVRVLEHIEMAEVVLGLRKRKK